MLAISSFFAALFIVSGIAAQAATGPNIVPNPSFETADATNANLPANWRQGGWGTNQATFTYPVAGADSARAAKLQLTSRTDGDAKWYFDPVAVTPGDIYTFSDKYQSTVPTFVTVEYKMSNGSFQYQDIVNPAAAANWTQAQATVTIPAGATSLTVYHLINQVGTLTIDTVSMTKNDSTPPPPDPTPTPTSTPPTPPESGNLIANGTLELAATGDASSPRSWTKNSWGTNQASHAYPVAGVNGTRAASLMLTSHTTGDAKWMFAPVNVTAGQTLTFSDQYKSTVPSYLTAEYRLNNGTMQYVDLANPPAASTWAPAQATFTVPANVTSLSIFHLIEQVGTLTTDSAYLSQTSSSNPTPTPTSTPPVPPTPSSTNLIVNADLSAASPNDSSLPANWSKAGWGTNQAVYTYPIVGANGGKGLEVKLNSRATGDAKWAFDSVSVTPGSNYRFSESYKATVPSYITAQFDMGNGTFTYADILVPAASNNWASLSVVISPPTGAAKMTIFHLINQIGTLATSGAVLSPPSAAPNVKFDQAMISLTFDDGWVSVYDNARPILNQAGIKPSLYLVSTFLDGSDPMYMNAAQMLQMQNEGYEIGSHTKTHAFLSELSQSEMVDEVAGSRRDLMAMGASPVETFVYPYGDYNTSVVQAVKDAGYIGARSVNSGFNDKTADHYLLQDQHVEVGTTPAQVQTWIDQAIANKTWLILEFHQQDYSGEQYSNTPETLQAIVNYIKQKNVRTVTMAEGLKLLNP